MKKEKKFGSRLFSAILPERLTEEKKPNGATAVSQADAGAQLEESYIYNSDAGTLVILTNEGTTDWRFDLSINYDYKIIKTLQINKEVTYIGDSAFEGCSGLKEVVLPNGLVNIGEKAFSRCGGITSVTFPESTKIIGELAFEECSALSSVQLESNDPALLKNSVFEAVCDNFKIYVPHEAVDIYKEAVGWCEYRDRITENLSDEEKLSQDVKAVSDEIGADPMPVMEETLSEENEAPEEIKFTDANEEISGADSISDEDWLDTEDLEESVLDDDWYGDDDENDEKEKKHLPDYVFILACSAALIAFITIIKKLFKKH